MPPKDKRTKLPPIKGEEEIHAKSQTGSCQNKNNERQKSTSEPSKTPFEQVRLRATEAVEQFTEQAKQGSPSKPSGGCAIYYFNEYQRTIPECNLKWSDQSRLGTNRRCVVDGANIYCDATLQRNSINSRSGENSFDGRKETDGKFCDIKAGKICLKRQDYTHGTAKSYASEDGKIVRTDGNKKKFVNNAELWDVLSLAAVNALSKDIPYRDEEIRKETRALRLIAEIAPFSLAGLIKALNRYVKGVSWRHSFGTRYAQMIEDFLNEDTSSYDKHIIQKRIRFEMLYIIDMALSGESEITN